MTYYIKNGSNFMVTDKENMDLYDRLPVGVYIVKFSKMMGYYLEHVSGFVLPTRLYGKLPRQAEKIVSSFKDRQLSTGVLLAGEKGSGKTLLAKLLASNMGKLGAPTIVINQPHTGDDFNKFIQDIEQEAVVLFDEFEKVYPKEQQTSMLTLMDGVFPTRKLFVLTCNDKWKVDSHMRNRPGRLYYLLDFKGLEDDFIREYCADTLNKQLHYDIENIVALASTVDAFNFDMLKALIEEMNRYMEPMREALPMLNVKPDPFIQARYNVLLTSPHGLEIPKNRLHNQQFVINPGTDWQYQFHFYKPAPKGSKKSRGDLSDEAPIFTSGNFVRVDPKTNEICYKNEDGWTLKLSRAKTNTGVNEYTSSYTRWAGEEPSIANEVPDLEELIGADNDDVEYNNDMP